MELKTLQQFKDKLIQMKDQEADAAMFEVIAHFIKQVKHEIEATEDGVYYLVDLE